MSWEDFKREAKEIGEKIAKKTGKMILTGVLLTTIGEITKKVAKWMEEDARESGQTQDSEVLPEQSDEE